MRRLGLLVVLALIGCGGSSTGSASGPPSDHVLTTNQPESAPTNTQVEVGPFSVPTGAVVSYSIVDTPTGVGSDTMNVGVVTAATVFSSSPVAYGIQENVASTSGSTQPLPADSYYVVVQCMNLVDDCIFRVSADATY